MKWNRDNNGDWSVRDEYGDVVWNAYLGIKFWRLTRDYESGFPQLIGLFRTLKDAKLVAEYISKKEKQYGTG